MKRLLSYLFLVLGLGLIFSRSIFAAPKILKSKVLEVCIVSEDVTIFQKYLDRTDGPWIKGSTIGLKKGQVLTVHGKKNQTNINNAIQSRSISIRIPQASKFEKFIHIKNILNKEKVDFNEFLLLKDCSDITNNIDSIINYHKYGIKYNNITDILAYKLIEIFNESQLNIDKIKEVSYDIKQLNILKEIILNIFNKVFTYYNNINKELLIKETARYEHIINKSYRDIIYLESYIIRLYKIINGL